MHFRAYRLLHQLAVQPVRTCELFIVAPGNATFMFFLETKKFHLNVSERKRSVWKMGTEWSYMVNQIILSNHSTTAILVTEIRGHCRKASQLRVAFIVGKPYNGCHLRPVLSFGKG